MLVSPDVFTEKFCCDLEKCKGICCVEGDAGAPVTMDEIMGIEDTLDTVWEDMSASAQSVVDKQGVAYTDREGDLVTSIVAEGLYGLNYHKWKICQDAVKKGQELDLPVYKFLEGPLVRRFGQAWYDELCEVANELKEQGYI